MESAGNSDTVSAVEKLFERYKGSMGVSSSLPSQTNRIERHEESLGDNDTLPSQATCARGGVVMSLKRVPLVERMRRRVHLQDLTRKGTDTRGIRYLVPEDDDGHSPSPCFLIHERRLKTLLDLEDALRDIQKSNGGSRLTQIGLKAGLNALAKASVNPKAEYN